MKLAPLGGLLLAASACAGTPAAEQRTAAHARGYYYSDDAGLSVTTGAAAVESPVGSSTQLGVVGIVENIHIAQPEATELPGAAFGHPHHGAEPAAPGQEPDIVSSASTIARVKSDSTLWRYEGQLHLRRGVGSSENPADIGVEARYSSEPDYRSLGVTLIGAIDLFERNLTLGGFLNAGRDTVDPEPPPPGEADEWPATHDRVYLGASFLQLLGPDTILLGTLTMGRQAGALENPYRRVLVRTSLFPERVPDARWRFSGSLGLARYLGSGFAVHLRNGMYGDSWGVRAWIPEAALVKELGPRFVADVQGRWYSQTAATFYRHHYDDLEENLTADVRLSSLSERALGGYLRFTVFPMSSPLGELTLDVGYERSWLDYRELDREVTGDLLQAGVAWEP